MTRPQAIRGTDRLRVWSGRRGRDLAAALGLLASHGRFVTFAGRMALLMNFFVMVAAYSTQGQKTMQVVAGSMRDAFGVDKESEFAGLLESEGLPAAGHVISLRTLPPEKAADRTTPPRRDQSSAFGLTETGEPDHVGLAVASLRQALPDIAELSKSVVIVRSDQDLDLSIVDQDGRSLVPDGSTGPNERTRRLLETLAPTLRQMPNRIAVTGFAATDDRFASVSGRADTEAMFPDNPYLAANRRVTVTLLKEASPVPNVKGLP
ncbi:flagellar motor protein MotB [Methylobacterium sp. GXS13]|jgi:chemotaxis protein MotB|uniref:flagellar motor protein MotB n=1 Tax=Methylobacterium sp. GXS13 TaxID=1730094 RepID=UPI0009EB3E4E|nr:flagellar motor protein MotB [Methylobacterium sp. GXS13]